MDFNFSKDELLRRTLFIEASEDFDPIAVLADEDKAHTMLYSGLDAKQRETLDMLVSAGVIPDDLLPD